MLVTRFKCVVCMCIFLIGAPLTLQHGAYAADSQNKQKTASTSKSNTTSSSKSNTKKKVVKVSKKPKAVRTTVTRSTKSSAPSRPSFATALGLRGAKDELNLKSSVAMVVNQDTKEVYFEKNSSVSLPIASITKLMTAMVILDSNLSLDETIVINADDAKIYSKSRLSQGTQLTRGEALLLALMSSENRAAYTLGRNYPGGIPAFIGAMNQKAAQIGMKHSHFADPTGLLSENVASAEDLTRMLSAAYQYDQIRDFSTRPDLTMMIKNRPQKFLNTNRLVRTGDMNIGLQKTGFISAAGRCLVMQARVNDTPLLLVFLDSVGTQSRFADAVRVSDWYKRAPAGEHLALRSLM